jgi:hypothetical protein
MSEVKPTTRRRHVARRARNVAAGLSAAAFVGFGTTMALAASGTSATASTHDPGSATTPTTQAPATVDPFAPLGNGDGGNYGQPDSFDDWGGQPAAPTQPLGSGATGTSGGDTSTHGS